MNTTLELTMNGIPSHGVKPRTGKLLQRDFENKGMRIMPELKISFEGRKLFANAAAEKFLENTDLKNEERMHTFFSHSHLGILKRGISEDFEITNGRFVFCFTAVAFDEAGYVGLYCYRIIKNKFQ